MNRTALIELKAKVEAGLSCGTWTATETDFAGAKWNEVYLAHQGSLDAAKALHDAVLPGWRWAVAEGAAKSQASVQKSITVREISAVNKIPARAWLLAILSALIAMETEEPKEGY